MYCFRKITSLLLLAIFLLMSTEAVSRANSYQEISFAGIDNKTYFLKIAVPFDDKLSGTGIEVVKSSHSNDDLLAENIEYKWLETVKDLYIAYKSNDLEGIKSLYYQGDGSGSRLAVQLSKSPEMFKGYSVVSDIEIGNVYFWGDYIAVGVKIKSNGKVLMRWAHLFYCNRNSDCLVSDRLIELDDSFELLSTLISLEKKPFSKKVEVNDLSQWQKIALYQADTNEILYKINFQPLAEKKYSDLFLGKKGELGKDQIYDALSHIHNFFMGSKKLVNEHGTDLQAVNQPGAAGDQLNTFYKLYWDNDYSRQFIQNYQFDYPEKLSDFEHIEFKSVFLTKNSITAKLAKVSNFIPRYYAKSGQYIFFWFLVEGATAKSSKIFAYDIESGKMISPLSSKIWNILLNPTFAKEIAKRMASIEAK